MSAPSLETVFCDRRFFGIETASPVQRAICRIAEGLPLGDLAACDDVRDAVGGAEALAILACGSFRPRELDLLCAIRSGKSFFVAAHAVWSSWTVNLDSLKPGELARHTVLSVNTKSGDATFNILAGTMLNQPALKRLLVGDPGAGSLYIRHPSGRVVECNVAAGARAGQNLISVWLTGVAFEEYPRQASEAAGFVVNYDEQLRAAAGRVVEGGQILSAGSPWAPSGPAWERFAAHFGRPTADRVVIKAPGPAMNPAWWTPARCQALKTSNPTAYVTDVLAGFADPSTAFIPQTDVRVATRREGPQVLPPNSARRYCAAMDPGGRGNRWSLVVVGAYSDAQGVVRYEVALAREWGGSSSDPLSPWQTMAEVKRLVSPYGVTSVASDQYAADAIRDIGARMGLDIVIRTVVAGNLRDDKEPNPHTIHRNDMYETMGGIFATGAISIPDDRTFVGDMLAIRRVHTRNGISYDLPETADRRHCDYAPATAMALAGFPQWTDARREAARRAHEEHITRQLIVSGFFNPPPELKGLSRDQLAMVLLRPDDAPVGAPAIMAKAGKEREEAAREADRKEEEQRPGLPKTDRVVYNRELLRVGATCLTARDLDELIEAGMIDVERKTKYLTDLEILKGRR